MGSTICFVPLHPQYHNPSLVVYRISYFVSRILSLAPFSDFFPLSSLSSLFSRTDEVQPILSPRLSIQSPLPIPSVNGLCTSHYPIKSRCCTANNINNTPQGSSGCAYTSRTAVNASNIANQKIVLPKMEDKLFAFAVARSFDVVQLVNTRFFLSWDRRRCALGGLIV